MTNSPFASKYLGYALLATVGGSVIGVLVGEKILPLYHYLCRMRLCTIPKILVPYNWKYAAIASFAAIICTIAATFLACYGSWTRSRQVMRPPSPKGWKRVFLERIGIMAGTLNFTWKSTVKESDALQAFFTDHIRDRRLYGPDAGRFWA